ncbi:MAG: hypothetical protein MJZ86_00790 [Bacteroidales bacterium]|nr:hypothetical protein [Bacteroidales bacterium]
MDEIKTITTNDYANRFESKKMAFLSSSECQRMQTDFMKGLKLSVPDGDVEEMNKYLHAQRNVILSTFQKNWLFNIWDKSFSHQINNFDEVSFYKKVEMVNDGDVSFDELVPFFNYYYSTKIIDSMILELEKRRINGISSIQAENVIIFKDKVVFKGNDEPEGGAVFTDEHLENKIFSVRLFNTENRLQTLRNTIASHINLYEDNDKFVSHSQFHIEPSAQNEWYYILAAICESNVLANNKCTDVGFIDQVFLWFPWLFDVKSAEELVSFKRNFAKSISAERGLWKYGKKKEVTSIANMWARHRVLNIEESKVERLQPVASYLRQELIDLRNTIERQI